MRAKPTINDFLFKNYGVDAKFTDCSFIDNYIKSNYVLSRTPIHCIVKKGESIRKRLWEFKKAGILKEITREGKGCSDEIMYQLVKKTLVVTEVTGSKVEEKEIKTGFFSGLLGKIGIK